MFGNDQQSPVTLVQPYELECEVGMPEGAGHSEQLSVWY